MKNTYGGILVLAIGLITAPSGAFGQSQADRSSYNIGEIGAGASIGKVKMNGGAPIANAIRSAAGGVLGKAGHTGSTSAGPDANGVYHYDDGTVGPGGLTTGTDGFTEIFSANNVGQTPEPPQPVCRSIYYHLNSSDTAISSQFNGLGGGSLGGRDQNYVAPSLHAKWGKMWKIRDGQKSDTFLGFEIGAWGSWSEVDSGEQEFDGTVTATTDRTTITHARELTQPLPSFPYTGTLWDGSGPGVPRVFLNPQREWTDHTQESHVANISGSIKQEVGFAVLALDVGPRLDHWIHLGQNSSLVLSVSGGAEFAFGFGQSDITGTMTYSIDGGSSQTKTFSEHKTDWDFAMRGYVGGSVGLTFGANQANELGIFGKATFGQSLQMCDVEVKPQAEFGLQYIRRF